MDKSLAIIGASGVVGSTIIKVLEEQNMMPSKLFLVASEKSVGKIVNCFGKQFSIVSIDEALNGKPDFAIFSAGKNVSLKYAPLFADAGIVVIDNSSAWRMCNEVPLVVPEINADAIGNSRIIANPNCSTIQLVLALSKLHEAFKIKRVVVSTYQSVTGSGKKGIDQLNAERSGVVCNDKAYHYQIDLNLIPHAGSFLDNDYTEEEMKLVCETRKILNDNELQISPTVVRVPVFGGHSESVNVEFFNDFDLDEAVQVLKSTSGVTVIDDVANNVYPMPLFAEGKDDVFVGRIRRDLSNANALNMWIVSDNLRKGAATNAVQILKSMI